MAFAALSVAVIAVPGPSVLFAVSRAIVAGRRDALLAVLGNASGLFVQVVLVAIGLGPVVAASDLARDALRIAGASYLAWLGLGAIRHRHDATRGMQATFAPTSVRPWRDGFVVGVTNPKSLVFLAVLLPGFVESAASPAAWQILALGSTFCLIAVASDGAWAMLAARARASFARDPRRLTWASVAGGLVMMALGLWLVAG